MYETLNQNLVDLLYLQVLQNHEETCIVNQAIDLVVVGPEVPLVNGVVDFLEAKDIKAFGPKKVPAKLEGSKIFMRENSASPTKGLYILDYWS